MRGKQTRPKHVLAAAERLDAALQQDGIAPIADADLPADGLPPPDRSHRQSDTRWQVGGRFTLTLHSAIHQQQRHGAVSIRLASQTPDGEELDGSGLIALAQDAFRVARIVSSFNRAEKRQAAVSAARAKATR